MAKDGKDNNRSSYHKKTKTVLSSIGGLFQPFKELMVNIVPSSKSIISFLDFVGRCVSRFILFIASLFPFIVKFVRGKALKIIVLVLFLLILTNTIITRVLNSSAYKATIAKAVTDATGYRTIIEGHVSVNLVLFSLALENAGFYSPVNRSGNLSLNLFTVNHLKIKFSFWSFLTGKLVAKNISVEHAQVRYKMVSGQHNGFSKFVELSNNLNGVTNLSADRHIFEEVNKKEDIANKYSRNIDNYKKYLNLKGIFHEDSNKPSATPFVQVDNGNFVYKFLTSIFGRISVDLASLNKLHFKNIIFSVLNSDDSVAFTIDNFSGNLVRKFGGKHSLIGEGRIFSKDMKIDFESAPVKGAQKFSFTAKYSDHVLSKVKDIDISGNIKNGLADGDLSLSGPTVAYLADFIVTQPHDSGLASSSYLTSKFNYSNNALSLTDMNLILNKAHHKGSLVYNFQDKGSLEVNLNVEIDKLEKLFDAFKEYKKEKSGSNFSIFSDMLLTWENAKRSWLTPRYLALNLQVDNATLNGRVLNQAKLEIFADDKDHLYIKNISLVGNDFSFNALGKVELSERTGVVIGSLNGNIDGLSSYMGFEENLTNFLKAAGGTNGDVSLKSKIFLAKDNLVFNDILGNLGDKQFKSANATFVDRNQKDLSINLSLEQLTFEDLQTIYNFNRSRNRTYYDDSQSMLGIPKSLSIKLALDSKKFNYKNLNLSDLHMDSTLIDTGILVHSFSVNNEQSSGSLSGSFSFNSSVMPSIVGNIDFNNFLIDTSKLQGIILNNFRIAGKVVLSGSVNVSGDSYFTGINTVSGNLSLTKYERLKLHKNNNSEGFYLTLMKATYNGKTYYQIGDLYGQISINNNIVDFYPAIIRYLEGSKAYRGSFKGGYSFSTNTFNITGELKPEGSKNKDKPIKFSLSGDAANAVIH